MKKIFITRMLPEKSLVDDLEKYFDVDVWEKDHPPSYEELIRRSKNCWGLLTMLTEKIDKNFINKTQSLKIIANMAVGYDNINTAFAKKNNIVVTNTPDVLTNSTAELTIALILLMSKRLPEANLAIRKKEWKEWSPTWMLGKDINGSTLGIIGPGKIGFAVASLAKKLNMQVNYSGKREKKSFPGNFLNLNELLSSSDYISVHLPLNNKTKYFLNYQHFNKMKSDAILINTSRGKIINQLDLEKAIINKTIGGAALDVTDPEPLPYSSKLLMMPNVFISPHLGSATKETRYKMAELAVLNLISFSTKAHAPNTIN